MTKKPMTQEDAARIQSHAARSQTNEDFKARAQRAAAKNAEGSKEGESSTERPYKDRGPAK